MALSTSEFVAESLSASSVGGQFGVVPTLASTHEAGSGIWLVEAWPEGSPDIARRLLFLPEHDGRCYISKMIITEQVLNYTSATVFQS